MREVMSSPFVRERNVSLLRMVSECLGSSSVDADFLLLFPQWLKRFYACVLSFRFFFSSQILRSTRQEWHP